MSVIRLLIKLNILICIALASCDFDSKNVYTDERTEEFELYDYYIDKYGNEGIVAYVSNSSTIKYAIAISVDESLESWGPMGVFLYNIENPNIEAERPEYGVAMHQIMKSVGIEKFPAQNWCDKKNQEEKVPRGGSWRLPTKKEFLSIIKQTKLNTALKSVGGIPFNTENMYWTCVEDIDGYIKINDVESDYDPENRAVVINLEKEVYGNKDRWIKKNKYYVRAIKYIYYEE